MPNNISNTIALIKLFSKLQKLPFQPGLVDFMWTRRYSNMNADNSKNTASLNCGP